MSDAVGLENGLDFALVGAAPEGSQDGSVGTALRGRGGNV